MWQRRVAGIALILVAAGAFFAFGESGAIGASTRIELLARVVETQGPDAEGWPPSVVRAQASALFAAIPQRPSPRGDLPFLLQFSTPITSTQRHAIARAGGRIVAFLPRHTCLIAVDVEGLRSVGDVTGVQWVGEWQAAYKVEPALAAIRNQATSQVEADAAEIAITIQTVGADDTAAIAEIVQKSGGTLLGVGAGFSGGVVRARVPGEVILALAAEGAVTWIERHVAPRLWNDLAVGGGAMNVTNVWFQHGLTGAGQIIGHADTGLDIGTTNGIHPDFAGKIVHAVGLGRGILGRGGRWDDPEGHGTHTAGSILGSGAASGGQYRGVAYGAKLVHQSVIDKLGLLTGIPTALEELFHEAYTNGARIHSDSWGAAVAGRYDTEAVQCDAYMWQHPDMLLVFAAGNDGVDADANGVIDLDSMGSPATAKNLLCVGAAESGRMPGTGGYASRTYGDSWGADYPVAPISNDFISVSPPGNGRGLAAFSSRGPTDDGRIKPDIVAPGTDIVSARSRNSAAGVAWGVVAGNTNYLFSGGTSMATPLSAGAAGLVRQYYTDVVGMTNLPPSAALIKATLVNGARNLAPGQYGVGPAQEVASGPRPNPVSGWGAVDLENSLFPSPPTQLRTVDWDLLDEGETNVYRLAVTAANRLTLTLAYSDYPGFSGGARALVNDLDLVLVSPAGVTNHPNGLSAADHVNNVEGIDLAAPAIGNYTVRVEGYDVPAGPQPYALVLRGAATLTGTNQRLRLAQSTYSVTEDAGAVEVAIQRGGGVSGSVAVHVMTAGSGSAQAGADFAATNITIVFGPGVTSMTTSIPVVNDAADEPAETFVVSLSDATGAGLVAPTQAAVTIVDDDGPGALQFESAVYGATEEAGTVMLAVVRRLGGTGAVSVQYATTDGTAFAGVDYGMSTGTLAFADGEDRREISVPLLDDAVPENAKSFTLRLSQPTGGAVLGNVATTLVSIAASDAERELVSANFDTGLPSGWSVVANVDPTAVWRFDDPGQRGNLTGGSNGFAIADSDFAGGVEMDTELRTPVLDFSNLQTASVEAKLDFRQWFAAPDEAGAVDASTNGAAGPWTNLVTVSGISVRGPRTVTRDLSFAAGMPAVMLRFRYYNARKDWWCQIDDVRIRGNVRAGPIVQRLRLADMNVWRRESAGVAEVEVQRTGGTNGIVVVDFDAGGGSALPQVDYVPTNGTLVFADGMLSNTIRVTLLDNARTESNRTFIVSLNNPTAPLLLADPTQAVVHIQDDDPVIATRLMERFEGGLPAGWATLADGAPGAGWRFDDPGQRTNQTGGAGGFAIADSAHFGPVAMAAEMRLPPLDLGVFEAVELVYRLDFNWYRFANDERADVEVSSQGDAGPWQLAARLAGAERRGPALTNLDLTALAARQTNVSIRFRYHNALGELWWQVDEVEVRGAVTGGNRDTDGDGLQDWWEAFHFGSVTNAVAEGDADGDGSGNRAEYLAGTDPRNLASRLHIDALVTPGTATVVFDTVSGKQYRLQYSTNLLEAWSPGSNIVGAGGSMSLGDDTSARERFYRIEVVP